jgi:hypothetical protein
VLLAATERQPRLGEEDRTDEAEVGERIAAGVIDELPARVADN